MKRIIKHFSFRSDCITNNGTPCIYFAIKILVQVCTVNYHKKKKKELNPGLNLIFFLRRNTKQIKLYTSYYLFF